MALVDPVMGLTVWNQPRDPYDYLQLANDWNILAFHDHTEGRGVQIPAGGLATNAVATANIQNAAVTNSKLATNVRRMTSTVQSGSYTAQPGDLIVAAAGAAITLPSAGSNTDVLIGISAKNDVVGSNPVTISGASLIRGVGISGSSFVLGTAFSFAVLQSDGTNWRMIAGGEDTGWVAITLGVHMSAGDSYTPSCRRVDGHVSLKGMLIVGAGANMNSLATVPSGYRPPSGGATLATSGGFGTMSGPITVLDTGKLVSAPTLGTGSYIPLNSCGYELIV